MTKNITIAVDEALARETRIAAATAGKSVSRFIADMLKEQVASVRSEKKIKEGVAEKLMEIGRRTAASQFSTREIQMRFFMTRSVSQNDRSGQFRFHGHPAAGA